MERNIHTEEHTDRMTSAELRKRTSEAMWGPLHLTIHSHCAGAELGYAAGLEAYHEQNDTTFTLEDAMHLYLSQTRYRPRVCTPKIVAEWQALFLLGWSSGLLETPMLSTRETEDLARRRYEASQPTLKEHDFLAQEKGQRP